MFNGRAVAAVIVAAGRSGRFGSDKMLLKIGGDTVIRRSVNAYIDCGYFDEIVVVAGENRPYLEKELQGYNLMIIDGGVNRFDSVLNGVKETKSEIIAVHDGARPFVTKDVIVRTLEAMEKARIAAPGVPVVDTIKLLDGGNYVQDTPPRERLVSVQTPQTFYREDYLKAAAECTLTAPTDDCGVMEQAGHEVLITKGDADNIKITLPQDIKATQGEAMRVGQGYDVHRLVRDRALVLGGVEIEYEYGLLGHSDADVLCHAISDALLGAAALGDIGKHFPDTDMRYKGANSIKLLCKVAGLLRKRNYRIANIDSTIVAQQPKLSPHIQAMRENIAAATGLPIDAVSVKATTEEKLGFTGNGEGIAAQAVVCINSL